jgi:hypothetical protein
MNKGHIYRCFICLKKMKRKKKQSNHNLKIHTDKVTCIPD